MSAQPKIAYLFSRYPIASQTFCDSEILALEAAGWKGEAGSALASADATSSFFSQTLTGAAEALFAPVSWAAIGLIGLWLILRATRRLRRIGRPVPAGHHDHDHHHDHKLSSRENSCSNLNVPHILCGTFFCSVGGRPKTISTGDAGGLHLAQDSLSKSAYGSSGRTL